MGFNDEFNRGFLDKMLGVNNVDPRTGLQKEDNLKLNHPDGGAFAGQSFAGGRAYDADDPHSTVYRTGDDFDIDQAMHDNQNAINRLSNAHGRLGMLTLNYGGQALAGVASLAWEGAKMVAPMTSLVAWPQEGNVVSRAVDNQLLDWFDDNSQEIKDYFPIYTSTAYRNGDQRFWSTDFFYDQGTDGLAFMLSNFIPMGAVSKLGTGARFARAAGGNLIARAAEKGVLKLSSKGAKMASAIDKGLALTVASASEAAIGAGGIQRSIIDNKELRNKYNAEEVQQMAADAAENSFQMNMALLMLTNLTEISTIFNASRIWGGAKAASRDAIAGIVTDEAGQLVRKALPWYKKTGATILKDVAMNAVSEGLLEENMQYTIEKILQNNLLDGPQDYNFVDIMGQMASNLGSLGQWYDGERAAGIKMGAALGAGHPLLMDATDFSKLVGGEGSLRKRVAERNKTIDATISKLNNAQADALNMADIYVRTPEQSVYLEADSNNNYYRTDAKVNSQGETYFDPNDRVPITSDDYIALTKEANIDPATGGEGVIPSKYLIENEGLVVDREKLEFQFKKLAKIQELNTVNSALSNEEDKNKFMINVVRNRILQELATGYFDLGLANMLYDKLDLIAQFDNKQGALFGIEINPQDKATVASKLQSAKQFVKEYERVYNDLRTALQITSTKAEDQALNKQRIAAVADRAGRILAIDHVLRDMGVEMIGQLSEFQTQLNNARPTDNPEYDARAQKAVNELNDFINRANGPNSTSQNLDIKLDDLENLSQEELEALGLNLFDTNYYNLRRNAQLAAQLIEQRKKLYNEWVEIAGVGKFKRSQFENARKYGVTEDIMTSKKEKTNKEDERKNRGIRYRNLYGRGKTPEKEVEVRDASTYELDGFKNFKARQEKIANKYNEYPGLSLALNPKVTIASFIKYELNRGLYLMLMDKQNFSRREQMGTNFRQLLQRNLNNPKNLQLLLKYLHANKALLNEDSLALLENAFFMHIDHINQLKQNKRTKETALAQAEFSLGEYEELLDDLQSKLAKAETETATAKILMTVTKGTPEFINRATEFTNAINKANTLRTKITEERANQLREEQTFDRLTNELLAINNELADLKIQDQQTIDTLIDDLRKGKEEYDEKMNRTPLDYYREISNEYLVVFDNVENAVESDLDFDNIETVDAAVDSLKELLRITKGRTDEVGMSEKFNKPELIAQIEARLARAEDLIDLINKRKADQLRKDTNFKNRHFNLLLDQAIALGRTLFPAETAHIESIMSQLNATPIDGFVDKVDEPEIFIYIDKVLGSVGRELDVAQETTMSELTGLLKTMISRYTYNLDDHMDEVKANLELLKNNPRKLMTYVLTQSTEPAQRGPGTAVAKAIKRGDLLEVTKYGTVSTDLLALAEGLEKYNAIVTLQNINRSKTKLPNGSIYHMYTNLKALVERAKQAKSNFPLSPSQELAVLTLLTDLAGSAPGNTLKVPAVYLPGPAGSGKTNIVLRYVMQLLPNINVNEIVATGPTMLSAEGIKNATGASHVPVLLEEILKDQTSFNAAVTGKKVLIIDEVGLMNYSMFNRFQTFLEGSGLNKPGSDFKVIFLGDPNQLTADVAHDVAIEVDRKKTGMEMVLDIQQSTSLMTVFRTNNPAILTVTTPYLGGGEVMNLRGRINLGLSELGNVGTSLIGALIDSGSANFLTALNHNVKANANATRAVLVNTQDQVIEMEKLLANNGLQDKIKVYTVRDVQGQTFDEVYVMINQSVNPNMNTSLYNQTMYTGISRAKDFVYAAFVPGATTSTDANLANEVQTIKDNQVPDFDTYIDYLSVIENTLLGAIKPSGVQLNSQVPTNPTATTPGNTTSTTTTPPSPVAPTTPASPTQNVPPTPTNSNVVTPQAPITNPQVLQEEEELAEEEEEVTQGVPGNQSLIRGVFESMEDDENAVSTGEVELEPAEKIEEETTVSDDEKASANPLEDIEDQDYLDVDSTRVMNDPYSEDITEDVDNDPAYENEIVQEALVEPKKVKGKMSLKNPTSKAIRRLKSLGKPVVAGRLVRNGNLVYLGYIEDGFSYYNEFHAIAVLSKEEVSLVSDYNTIPQLTLTPGSNPDSFYMSKDELQSVEDFHTANQLEIEIDANESNGLEYRYYPTQKDGGAQARNLNFGKLLTRFIEQLFNGYSEEFKAKAFEDAQRNSVLRVFSRRDALQFSNAHGMKPIAGVPYLEVIFDTSAGKTTHHLIRLTPKRLNWNKHSRMLKPINTYIDTIETFEKAWEGLKGRLTEEILQQIGINPEGRKTFLDAFDAFGRLGNKSFPQLLAVLSLVDGNIMSNLQNFTNNLNPNNDLFNMSVLVLKLMQFNDSYIAEDLFKLGDIARKAEILIHGERKPDRKIQRKHNGEAQRAFNKIARANFYTNGLDDRLIVLRDERYIFFEENGQTEKKAEVVGRSLLGFISNKVQYSFSQNIKAMVDNLRSRIAKQSYGNKKLSENKDISFQRTTMTLAELKKIFHSDFQQQTGANNLNHKGKEGFGLRVPITYRTFNNRPISSDNKILVTRGKTKANVAKTVKYKLEDYFEENFEQIIPSSAIVSITKGGQSIVPNTPTPTRPNPTAPVKPEIIVTDPSSIDTDYLLEELGIDLDNVGPDEVDNINKQGRESINDNC